MKKSETLGRILSSIFIGDILWICLIDFLSFPIHVRSYNFLSTPGLFQEASPNWSPNSSSQLKPFKMPSLEHPLLALRNYWPGRGQQEYWWLAQGPCQRRERSGAWILTKSNLGSTILEVFETPSQDLCVNSWVTTSGLLGVPLGLPVIFIIFKRFYMWKWVLDHTQLW